METQETIIPVAPKLRELNIGESADFPMNKLTTVRTTIQTVQMMYNKKFKQKIVRKDQVINVVRTA